MAYSPRIGISIEQSRDRVRRARDDRLGGEESDAVQTIRATGAVGIGRFCCSCSTASVCLNPLWPAVATLSPPIPTGRSISTGLMRSSLGVLVHHSKRITRGEKSTGPAAAPCSGPGCSRRVPMPIPTVFFDSDRFDQWGHLATLVTIPSVSPPNRTVEEPAARPSGQKPSIFHPPPV